MDKGEDAPTASKFPKQQREDVFSPKEQIRRFREDGSVAEERRGGAHINVPVLVYHGGGFVGDRLYEPWWSDWLLELALAQSAMIVAPDYRLLPEATGADIMDDMDAFWTWFLRNTAPSAGGTIASHSALERPDAAVKAVVSLYGPLYGNVPGLKMSRPRKILGSMPPPPRQAEANNIRSYIQRTKVAVRTHGDVLEMWGLFACILQQGRLP
ncbi:alpha/beta hydrolase [Aspergillus tanneri]|uniref:Alpha/beta hydrolase fold-3 domain-containing protein n=1 Tax=Aspergillus tanneri TaxID=1220188 RepID=A0A5M9MLZ2_9EURO|nr:uncharacterized protein ATNIH1004_003914 [Aspergillus tanneri]KAA8648031.1 hypothetical protein ATNIH1004_003914 [Aspergillus tanneri]